MKNPYALILALAVYVAIVTGAHVEEWWSSLLTVAGLLGLGMLAGAATKD